MPAHPCSPSRALTNAMMPIALWPALLCTLLALLPRIGACAADGDAAFTSLADDYLDRYYFPTFPTAATEAGIHRHDAELEDYSHAAIARRIAALKVYQRRFEAIDPAALSERVAADRELLLSSIRGARLTLETIRPWQQNPDIYPSGIAESAISLMNRSFAPLQQRLGSLIARERRMPAVLQAARANLRNPPEIFTRIALEQLPGTIDFFDSDLPAAFSTLDDPALRSRLDSVNRRTVAALKSYQRWLRSELLSRSHGDFRLGAETFSAKLRYDEMVDTPLPQLLEIGTADLKHNQAQFARVAHELEPDKSAQQVLDELTSAHPEPAALLASFQATFDSLIDFIQTHHIISLPSSVRPILQETPPFMRATTIASMDTPGPFESVAQEAYFYVTLPDPAWDAARTEEFMTQYPYADISNTAVHEAYPGHYVQFLWIHQINDRVRQLIGADSNAEGWAHYCEQMMLDEGYDGAAGTDESQPARQRQRQLLRLAQLQDALLRDARFIVGIRMHTGDMSLKQAEDFFVQEGYQPRQVAEIETKRGTADPTYLYYTLGKLQILKLRSDVAAREGAAFELGRFHDAFMQQGFPPIKLVRRALLHDDSPTL
jgi:uncharacterized protein (DUF885 family)